MFPVTAIFAVKDTLSQAGLPLLEPIMAVECVAPDEFRGNLPIESVGCSGAVPDGFSPGHRPR